MNFTNLLRSTIRLADTYDLARTPGAIGYSVGSEDRRKSTSGLWFLLATKLLEYLHLQDSNMPMAYHSIELFHDSLSGTLSVFSLDDVKYMVNLLSKEFELKFHDAEIQRMKAGTPLIEKRSSGFSCKLTPNGLTAINLSFAAEELLYGDQIAHQVKKALELGDFERYMEYADKLINTMISQSYEVINLVEISGQNELRDHYNNKSAAYIETLDDITNTAGTIGENLKSKTTEALLDSFIINNPDKQHYEQLLYVKLDQINVALLGFRGNLSRFLETFYSVQDNVAPTVDFHEVSLSILNNKIPVSSHENILSLYGFWGATPAIACPDYDLFETVQLDESKKVVRPTFTRGKTVAVRDKVQEYVDRNLDEISEVIAKQGFFSLSQAIKNKAIECYTIEDFTAIVGFCLTPSESETGLGDLVVSINNKEDVGDTVDGYILSYNDLILRVAS